MSEVLDRARAIERDTSNETTVRIRLTLLQDLIAEIERLEAERPASVRTIKAAAEQRQGAGQ